MVEHLKLDGVSLQAAKSQIALARSDFADGNVRTDQVAESVGHQELGDSIRKMGADWSIKREKLSLKLATIEANLEASIQAFGDWDTSVAEAFSAPSVSAVPGAQGPAQQSAGAGQASVASTPAVPDFADASPDAASPSHGQAQGVPDTADTPPAAAGSAPHAPFVGGVPMTGQAPDALTDVIDRLSRSTQGWERLPGTEQALLFTAIGTAGLTLLVRAGKLPSSVLDLAGSSPTANGSAIPTTTANSRPARGAGEDAAAEGARVPTEGTKNSLEGAVSPGEGPVDAARVDTDEPDVVESEAPPGSPPVPEEPAPVEPEPAVPGESEAASDLPEVPDFAAAPPDAPLGGGSGVGSGGLSATLSGAAAPLQESALPPVPSLSELMDGPSGSSTSGVAVPIDLPSLAASLDTGATDAQALAGDVSAGPAMSAGMGMTSMAHTLGGAANTASSSVAARAVHEGKLRDAVKALNDLRDEQKEDRQ